MKVKLLFKQLIFLPNKLLSGLIKLYQKTISPLLGERCRYWPSCSRYATEALQTHNLFKAVALSVWRVIRCNPFSGGGLDPVPAKGKWRADINTDGSTRTRP